MKTTILSVLIILCSPNLILCYGEALDPAHVITQIESNQTRVNNIEATFVLHRTYRDDKGTRTKSQRVEWLWDRNRVKLVKRDLAYDEKLKEFNLTRPPAYYYAFDGEQAVSFNEEYLEKGLQGYLIGERDTIDQCFENPARLWFISWAGDEYIDILKNNGKGTSLMKCEVLDSAATIDGQDCILIYCEYKRFFTGSSYYSKKWVKLWVDPAHNFVFRRTEEGNMPQQDEITIEPPNAIYAVTDLTFAEVLPGFYLPQKGRIRTALKGNLDDTKNLGWDSIIEVDYAGINLPLTQRDFQFEMRDDRLIYNALLKIGGRNKKQYLEKVQQFRNKFSTPQ